MATIVIFWFFLLLVLLLLLLKYFEIKKGKNIKLLQFLSHFDFFFEKCKVFVDYKLLQVKQTIKYIFVVYIPDIIGRKTQKYKENINIKINNNKEMLMGKRELENKGSSSFFLRKIDENKKNAKKGEINDFL